MMKKGTYFVGILMMALSSMFLATSCTNSSLKTQLKNGTKVNTVEEFKQALSNGAKSILTSDLDFNNETITINHDVTIDSIDNESELKNVYFSLSGPKVVGEKINVFFSNIIFDGMVDASGIDFTTSQSFEEKFGSDREAYRCISGNDGYFCLSLMDCVIRNYASEVGPAIFIENYDLNDIKQFTLYNCKVYNNYSAWDTIHLSHQKLVAAILNSEFYANHAYKSAGFSIAGGSATIDKVNVHDNIFAPYDVDQNNFQLAGGGVYIGGVDLRMKNSYIVNNKTIYGGGLAVSTPYVGSKNMVFENISIKNNEATYGGGIVAFSLSGQPLTFIDCEVLCNKATEGSALYTEVYAKFNKNNNGGLVQFFFTTFGLNTANDNNCFNFYREEKTKGELGTISLKGCFSIGNDTYNSSSEDYNYVATKEQALLDGVISEEDIENASNGLYPIQGSKGDIKVSASTYQNWSDEFSSSTKQRSIGKSRVVKKSYVNYLIDAIVAVSVIIIVALVTALIIILVSKKKKKEVVHATNNNVKVEEKDMRQEYLSSLSERERKVVELIVAGKKRKEIAEELNYSENTIKKDLTIIYSKLHVLDKYALILQYKDLL